MTVAASRARPRHALEHSLKLTLGKTVPFSMAVVGAGLWAASLQGIDLERVTGVGLISALPPQMFVAMALFTWSFMLTVHRPRISLPLATLQLGMWIVMLHGVNSLVASEPVFPVAWRHAGITEYIIRNRGLDAGIDAYFSWPGFFGLSALLTEIADLTSPVALIRWAPVFFNFLYLTPLVLIFKSTLLDQRAVCLALWLFYTTNWIGQDYFAPQALAYFSYLLVLGILLKWFTSAQARRPWMERFLFKVKRLRRAGLELGESAGDEISEATGASQRLQRLLAAAVLIVAFTADVPSHQLTPFAILMGVTLLVVGNQITLRGLPLLMGVALATWISYMTVTFLAGHLDMVLSPLSLAESAEANVQGRVQGSRQHMIVVYGRILMTSLVWLLAAVGAVRIRQRSNRTFACMILAAAPFPLLLLQAYGGEMLLRVYLFSLPFCALFTAGLLSIRGFDAQRSVRSVFVCTALGVVLLGGFLLIRYGNQTIDRFTPGEVDAVATLYRIAPTGSVLIAGDNNLPWKYRGYERYEYKTLADYRLDFADPDSMVSGIEKLMQGEGNREAFLIITRGQKEAVNLLGVPAPADKSPEARFGGGDWLTYVEATLKDSPKFDQILTTDDSTIFTLASGQ